MPLGIYLSVPFCKTKCSYCNFASGVFSRDRMQGYIDRLCWQIAGAEDVARKLGAKFEREVDSIYVGGGTPTFLAPLQIQQIFARLRENFIFTGDCETTVECAPGTLSSAMLQALVECGVNRVSLGVQSFCDQESRSVGRLHTREQVAQDIAALRAAGISNINVDLIAGLPHQTSVSWQESLDCAIAAALPHVSVYMLEVDEDSRLGRELLAGGNRYHAHFAPNADLTAGLYARACECLAAAAIAQYEISNFARPGMHSRHNLKYWTRRPYLGFGVDAHSMLLANASLGSTGVEALRFAAPAALDAYMAGGSGRRDPFLAVDSISPQQALEEEFFLGLRLNCGVEFAAVEGKFGPSATAWAREVIEGPLQLELVEFDGRVLRLTARGRLLSNEVFQLFIAGAGCEAQPVASLTAAPLVQ